MLKLELRWLMFTFQVNPRYSWGKCRKHLYWYLSLKYSFLASFLSLIFNWKILFFGNVVICIFFLIQQVLNTISPFGSGHIVEASSQKQPGDVILRQHTLRTWYSTSSDAVDSVHKYGTARQRSHNRQLTHMSFSKSVYSFEVKEDTVPG